MSQSPIPSIHDPQVREDICVVLATLADAVAVIRVAGGAGSRHWFLLQAPEDVDEMLRWAQPVDAIDVYREPQLPVRGRLGVEFRRAIDRLASEAEEWLIACQSEGQIHLAEIFEGWNGDPESAAEVFHWLDAHEGARVIAGPHPLGLETASVLTAYVPLPDGTRMRGAY